MHAKLQMFSLAAILLSFNLSAGEPYSSHTSDKWQVWAYSSAAPYVVSTGTDYAHLLIPVEGY
ncbi:hypothetical protein N8349_00385 [Gammaproteobacteria bacterium]|nr:hypothetical protein [Gammaproteobacteria bacterium]